MTTFRKKGRRARGSNSNSVRGFKESLRRDDDDDNYYFGDSVTCMPPPPPGTAANNLRGYARRFATSFQRSSHDNTA
eukprot:1185180-Prorocentrum_minimum.AAC.2